VTVKQPLTIAEVDALFNRTLQPRATKASRSAKPAAFVARYDRCSSCHDITPCLSSFSGDTDWSPGLPLDDPIRDAIKDLRRTTGRRTILLCSHCSSELRHYRRPTPADELSARLFELDER